MLYHANRINVAMMQINTCMNKLIKTYPDQPTHHDLSDQGILNFANVKFKFQYKSVKDSINLSSQ